ncbi:MAG: LysR family transcriptional regulator [Gammaproteobacteria bacterium]|nr:LysR family transcriptional regulator [Gammaproteobacteria bacterium]
MKNITLRQLRVFEAVARHSSYTRAAGDLYLTQPAISMQIKQLEGNIGLPLFEQIGKRIFLTEAGRELYHYSRLITQQLAEAEAVLSELKGVTRGRLNISVVSTAKHFAPYLLSIFSKRFDGATVSLNVTNRETLLRQLASNERDMMIMGVPPKQDDIIAEPFMENPLVVIAPYNHPLRQERNIPLERLQHETFLMREQGSGTRIAMERFFAEHNIHLIGGMEMDSSEAIKQGVQAGLGLGIVSIHTINLEIEVKRLAILDVASLPIIRQWYLVHPRDKRLSPVAQAFKEFILNEAKGLLESMRGGEVPAQVSNKSKPAKDAKQHP